MTQIHRDRIDDLRQEVDEKTARYNQLGRQVSQLQSQQKRLISLRDERQGVANWSYEERQFVVEVSRKLT